MRNGVTPRKSIFKTELTFRSLAFCKRQIMKNFYHGVTRSFTENLRFTTPRIARCNRVDEKGGTLKIAAKAASLRTIKSQFMEKAANL
jgi:hypothetical protein